MIWGKRKVRIISQGSNLDFLRKNKEFDLRQRRDEKFFVMDEKEQDKVLDQIFVMNKFFVLDRISMKGPNLCGRIKFYRS